MQYTIETALMEYFPKFEIKISVVNDVTYATVTDFVSYTLRKLNGCVAIEDMKLSTDNDDIYIDSKKGYEMDSLYAMHAIVSSIIICRDRMYNRLIISNDDYFHKYLKLAFNKYAERNALIIDDLIKIESGKFTYLDIIQQNLSNVRRIGYNVSSFPIGIIMKNYKSFSILGTVIPFNPCLQNIRVLIQVANYVPLDRYSGVLNEVITIGGLKSNVVVDIIDKYFNSNITADMVNNLPIFKSFNQYLIDKYKLVERGLFAQISKMDNIPDYFLDEYSKQLYPHIDNILTNPYCPIERIKKYKKDIRRYNLWAPILSSNKFMTRKFLLSHIRKYPNALIERINILDIGDEKYFKRYKRKLKWDELVYKANCDNIDIVTIAKYGEAYIGKEHMLKIIDINSRMKK